MTHRLAALAALMGCLAWADTRGCRCDPAQPETMEARECALCRETEKQPPQPPFYTLKDNNPRKPNRWLVLPRFHTKGPHELADMTAEQRTGFWAAAIAKATELWGDKWGIALNATETRTQCHTHVHIGRLLEGIETSEFVVVASPAEIPLPRDDSEGFWVHPVGGKLHVHRGEVITETVLLR
jgi:hypothetical protein